MSSRLLTTWLLMALTHITSAQAQNGTDSLDKVIASYKNKDKGKVDLLIASGETAIPLNMEKANAYITEAAGLAQRLNYANGIINSLLVSGFIKFRSLKYNEALSHLQEAEKMLEITPDKSLSARLNYLYSILYRNKGQYSFAIEKGNKALMLATSDKQKADIHNGLASIRLHMLIRDKDNPELKQTALYHLHEALLLSLKPELFAHQRIVYSNYGNYYKPRNLDSAVFYFQKAAQVCQQLGYNADLAAMYSHVSESYSAANKPDSAILYTNKHLAVVRGLDNKMDVLLALKEIGENYRKTGNLVKALAYKDSVLVAMHEQMDDTKKKQFAEMQTRYETEKKQQQIELLNKDKELRDALLQRQQLAFINERRKSQLELLNSNNALQTARLNEQAAQIESSQKANALQKISGEKELLSKEKLLQASRLRQQKILSYSLVAVAVLLIALAVLFFSRLQLKQKANFILNEKNERIETLIRELHHRVKNNMQVISSLLSLQSVKLDNREAREAVKDGQLRVEAMGLIHQKLYLNADITSINMKEYLESLTSNLLLSYQPAAREAIKLKTEIAAIQLDVDTAVPLGLIANELITNSLKYAFSGNAHPFLQVKLFHLNGSLILSVKDNGPGININRNDNGSSFGLKLVDMLTRQLKGKMIVTHQEGIEYQLTIPGNFLKNAA